MTSTQTQSGETQPDTSELNNVLAQVPGDMADSFATVFIVATILVACCIIPAAFLPRTKMAPVDPTAMMGH